MLKLVALCMAVALASAATSQGPAPKKPPHLAHKQGCYVEELKDVVADGSTTTPIGVCVRIECAGDWLYYATCGVVYTDDPGCHTTAGDLTKPYPKCCPDIECDSDNQV